MKTRLQVDRNRNFYRLILYSIGFFFLTPLEGAFAQCVFTSGPSEICVGEPAYYYATLNLGCCPTQACETGSFQWDISGGTIIASSQLETTAEAVVIWNEGGGTIGAGHSWFYPPTSYVNSVPFPDPPDPGNITTSSSSLCPGDVITISSDVGTGWPGNYQFEWEYSTNGGASWNPMNPTLTTSTTFTLSAANTSNYDILFHVRTVSLDCSNRMSPYRQTAPASAYRFPDLSIAAVNQICDNISTAGIQVTHNNPGASGYSDVFINVQGSPFVYPKGAIPKIDRAPATYNVIARDYSSASNYNPCEVSASVAVGVVAPRPTVSVSIPSGNVVNEVCYNPSAHTGSITVNASGTTSISSYAWDNGVGTTSSATVNNLPGDVTYSVVVTDGNGCTGSSSAFVNQPDAIAISSATTSSPVSCPGATNGQITIAASGGTGDLDYSIDGGGSFQDGNSFSGLAAGNYPIAVRDDNLCIEYGSTLVVGTPSAPSAGTPSVTHPTCSGSSTGSFTLNASGGVGTLSYSIPGYAAQTVGNAITGVAPGTYAITITDGCANYSAGSVVINQPVSATHSVNVASCNTVNDGSISIGSPSGGTGSYTYALNYGSYSTFTATTNFTGLPAGSGYVVSVRDGNSCTFQITGISVGLRPTITPGISQTSQILCNGQATGELNLTPGAGWTAPYTYAWRRNTVLTGLTTEDISGLTAGTYEVTITDGVGCSTTATQAISEPSALTAGFSIPQTNGFAIACRNGLTGSINLTPGGGTPGGGPAYTYLWYRNEVSTGIATEDLAGLDAGNYRVRITDGNGCQFNTANQILNEPPTSVSISVTAESDISCFNANNGSITVSGVTGFGALEYRLDGVTHDVAYQASNSFIGLPPDTYTVTSRDANGCTATTGSVFITQPATALNFSSIVPSNPNCAGAATGSFTLTAEGGTSPYEFTVNGINFFTSTIPNLSANTYTITASDANGCEVVQSNQVLTNPPSIIFNAVTTDPQSCAAVVDGRINITASGGTGALQFSLNAIDYQTNSTFESLTQGSYTIRARDANSCIATNPASVGIVPAIAPIVVQTASVTCFGFSNAALTVNTTGGSGVYSYAWSNASTTQAISGLNAGTYDVVVTDDKGCSGTDDITITQPATLNLSLSPSDYSGFGVTCPSATDGFINLTVAGGTAPFSYSWSNGAVIKDISSLAANSYNVTVTDANFCQSNSGLTLVAPSPVVVVEDNKTNVTCHGGNNGSVTLEGSGGADGYEFSIDNGASWQTLPTFSTLTAGGYTVSVRDDNSCTNQVNITIEQPTLIDVNVFNVVHTTCGNSNGSAEVSSSGGTGSHVYEWVNSAATAIGTGTSISLLPAGIYTVTVSDEELCEIAEQVIINTSDGTDFLVTSITPTTCSYSEDGGAQVQIVDGNGPYTIVWVDDVTGTSASHLPAGNTIVNVIDVDGCNTFQQFSVPSPPPLAIVSQVILPPVCPGEANASVEVQISGGTGIYGYTWNNAAGTNLLENVGPGHHTLKVTDANDCEYNSTITVVDLSPIVVSLVSASVPTCSGTTDGIITVTATGANGDFTYSWPDENVSSSQLAGVGGGSYQVVAIDDRGCTADEVFTLVAPDVVTVSLNSSQPTSCNGTSDGALTLTADGGVGTYSYSIDNGNLWQTSSTFNDLTAQEWPIMAKDLNGCTASSIATITQPDIINVTASEIVHTTCGQNNGEAIAVAAGGNGTYFYGWTNALSENVSSNLTLTGAVSGTYTILVRDQLNCEGSTTVEILPSAVSEINVKSIVQTACVNSADGKAEVEIISGPAPHTFLWSSNEVTASAVQLTSGSNSVTVTDANNCVTVQTFVVPAPTAISLSTEVVTRPACPGGSTGSIQILPAGGAGNYSYSWNGVTGTNSLSNLIAGTYQLEVRDAKNCLFTKSIVVPAVPMIEILLAEAVSPTCFGGSNGSLQVTAQGGNGTFSLAWQNGATGFFVSGLTAGTYPVEATDINGCKAQNQFVVVNPPPVTINVGSDKIICPGQVLSFDPGITASSYTWTGPSGFASTNHQIDISAAGTYTLRIIDSDGCSAEDALNVSISDQLLHADLIMAGEAFAMDTIMVIDISWPVPDVVNWEFGAEATVIQSTNDFAMIQYTEPGTYTVTINANLAGCQGSFSQVIRIYEQRDADNGRENTDEPLHFVSYSAYPNPFREQLDVAIDFNRATALTLQLVNVSSNKVVFESLLPEDFEHRKTFLTGNIIPGIYVLVIRAGDEIKSMRLLKL